ncbi:MAG TPA: hypothetical protein VJ600_04210 [Holophagaceae bacterium]|nr:hypothetical protein [Holophagaceae bacterium]
MTLADALRSAIDTLERWAAPFVRFWEGVLDAWSILKPCRFSLVIVLIAGYVLGFNDQGQELLRSLADWDQPGYPWRLFAFAVAALLWAMGSWYWARQMLKIHYPHSRPPSLRIRWYRTWVPRLLGFLAFGAITFAFLNAVESYASPLSPQAVRLIGFAVVSGLMGIGYGAFVIRRRKLFPSVQPGDEARRTAEEEGRLGRSADLPGTTLKLLFLSLLLSFTSFLVFAIRPLRLPVALGSASIFLLAAACWIPFGSFCVYFATRRRIPVLTLGLLAAVLFSLWNDNHAVRKANPASPLGARESLEASVKAWFEARKDQIPPEGQGRYPVFLVASAGGGIRAAYWTANVLSALEDHSPDSVHPFSSHVFGLSGVSGGSLGNAVFAAMVQRRLEAQRQQPPGSPSAPLSPLARQMLGRDLLSAPLATLLYPDLVQRFLPFGIPAFDRAKTIERTWEFAWRDTFGDDRFRKPMDDLWKGDTKRQLPSLFLNGTSVEQGCRIIASNMAISPAEFPYAADAQGTLGSDLPLSTAAHLSARFTYVSPAGTLKDANGRAVGHVVDGGYFENSGTTTAMDLMEAIQNYLVDTGDLSKRVRIVVLIIENDPLRPPPDRSQTVVNLGPPDHLLNEVASPLNAMLSTRGARGTTAEATIQALVEEDETEGEYINLFPRDRHAHLPLGWMLASNSRMNLDEQIDLQLKAQDPAHEQHSLHRVLAILQAR